MTYIQSTPTDSLFRACITVRIKIDGCPESGLAALDFRRKHGLPDRLDNRHDVELKGDISEADFRELIKAGWKSSSFTDGGQRVDMCGLREAYSPVMQYGHCAMIPVYASDSPVRLACRALKACAREQRRKDVGADKLESELQVLEVRKAEILNLLGEE